VTNRAIQLRLLPAPRAEALDGNAWLASMANDARDLIDCVLSELEARGGRLSLVDGEVELWDLGVTLRARLETVRLATWVASDLRAVERFMDRADDILGMRIARFNVAKDALRKRMEGR